MGIDLGSFAERKAQQAESLSAFGGLNLLHIKRQVAAILQLIGRNGIFDEYTRHDVDHVDKMLAMLEWLVPDDTKEFMIPTDWLLVVLATYFHDIGMLVTRDEYSERTRSDFAGFVEDVLYTGDQGNEYRHKVAALEGEARERFLYQEFVRHCHAERSASWITGSPALKLGVTEKTATEVSGLLSSLSPLFRRDLGFVAESHHLDDLNDTKKYRVSQPYGDSEAETGNLQYAAVILRVADLLHITADRTPAVAYRLIDPVDPLSQAEWAKQAAVNRVRSKARLDDNGTPDPKLPRDTIEVHAFFRKEDGFFALTTYLTYAAQQLQKCHQWIEDSRRRNLASHRFPWSKIDDTDIETEGFMRDAFQFSIDQTRILDLLTGHTLYNDSSVVLRELIQNSLDAIRLSHFEDSTSAPGDVTIRWDSTSRLLTVTDNGAGMTQETIRSHLLRVGSSLYQDPAFLKAHPGFASISRFGIGVLSTFMIADSVEIITCHPQEEDARQLTLRSVHGRYLIRLVSKQSELVTPIAPHGTIFKLRVRQTVNAPDFLSDARHWVIVPGCRVSVKIDDQDPVLIGFESPKEAIVRYLKSQGYRVLDSIPESVPHDDSSKLSCVAEREVKGATVAFALRWAPYFHEWAFMQSSFDPSSPICTCIEGIRLDTATPGYVGNMITALANASGENSPKTNVSRSGLEASPERDALVAAVYRAYCEHVGDEIANLTEKRGHSLTWAIQEAHYLLDALLPRRELWDTVEPLSRELLAEAISEVPIHLIETAAGRKSVSTKELGQEQGFWTIMSPLFRSAEALIRETPGNASIRSVISSLGTPVDLPDDPLLCQTGVDSAFQEMAFKGREICRINVRKQQRRLDLKWGHTTSPARWLTLPPAWSRWLSTLSEQRRYTEMTRGFAKTVMVSHGTIETEGLSGEMAIRLGSKIFFLGDSPAVRYTRDALQQELSKGDYDHRLPPIVGVLALFDSLLVGRDIEADSIDATARRIWMKVINDLPSEAVDDEWERQIRDDGLVRAIVDSDWFVLNPLLWEKR